MEKAPRLSSNIFFDSENDLLCVTKNFLDFSFPSTKWKEILGYSEEEMNSLAIKDLIHPDDWDKTQKIFELARTQTRVSQVENRFVSKDKTIKWLEWSFYQDGESDLSFIGVARDLTELKIKDHFLKISQTHASLGTWQFYSSQGVFICSEELHHLFEIDIAENLSYAKVASFYDEDNWNKFNSAFTECLEKGTPWNIEIELTTEKNNLKWVQSWGSAIRIGSEIIGIEGVIQNLTRKRNESVLLKQTVEELDKIQMSINQHCLVGRLNPFGYFMDVNSIYEKKSGYRLAEFIGRNFLEFADQHKNEHDFHDILSLLTKGNKWRGEFRLKTKSGGDLWVDMSLSPIMDQSDELYEIVLISYDVTEKKLNDERYQTVISGINAGIWDWPDLSKPEIYWSPKFYEILDYDPTKVSPTAEHFLNLIHADDQKNVDEKISHAIKHESNVLLEFRVLSGSGKYKWIQILGIILRNEENRAYRLIGSITDINQKKLIEFNLEEEKQKTIQNSKLATLGEMAAGLAHEVNNPLTIIFGYIRILEEELLDQELNYELMHKHVGLIKNAAQRAAKIVTNLKDFARDGSSDPFIEIPAAELVSMVMDLCNERFKKNGIRMELELNNNPKIYCRKIELSQVLLNILFNAFDAIEERKDKWVKFSVQELPQFVEISITDSGPGLSTEVAEKIFTPFFTTKKVGQGTGIGLSISQRIVLNHGGSMFYDNSSPHTKFVVRLPFHERL